MTWPTTIYFKILMLSCNFTLVLNCVYIPLSFEKFPESDKIYKLPVLKQNTPQSHINKFNYLQDFKFMVGKASFLEDNCLCNFVNI